MTSWSKSSLWMRAIEHWPGIRLFNRSRLSDVIVVRHEGRCIAALHVSQNLKTPFAQLKAEMVRPDRDSLGQAIHDRQPSANAKAAAKTAEQEARTDIEATKPAKADAEKNKNGR